MFNSSPVTVLTILVTNVASFYYDCFFFNSVIDTIKNNVVTFTACHLLQRKNQFFKKNKDYGGRQEQLPVLFPSPWERGLHRVRAQLARQRFLAEMYRTGLYCTVHLLLSIYTGCMRHNCIQVETGLRIRASPP